MVTDEQITEHINSFYMESMVKQAEDQLLHFLKMRQEKFPSEKHDREWLEFSDYVCKRRKF